MSISLLDPHLPLSHRLKQASLFGYDVDTFLRMVEALATALCSIRQSAFSIEVLDENCMVDKLGVRWHNIFQQIKDEWNMDTWRSLTLIEPNEAHSPSINF